jgi:propanol-preferring alcohol dehydrogenase
VVDAAPLTDAALTPYHAVRRSLGKLGPGSTALVIGVGGLGHLGVQILEAITSARVVAVDGRDEARELARTLGADLALAPGDESAALVRAATVEGRGVDVVLDFVGSDETLALAAQVVRQLGDLTIVGIAGGTLPVSFFGLPYETSVQTTYWGNRRELVEVLDLAARGLIHAESTIYTLDDAVDAYRDLEHGNVRGRAVVVPNDTFTG